MLANGDDPARSPTNRSTVLERVKAASDSGHIRRFTGNDYTGPLSNGDLKAASRGRGHRPAPARQREPEVEHPAAAG